MRRIHHLYTLYIAAAALAWSQTPPTPELKKLQSVVGQWTCSREAKLPSPSKSTSTYECSWEKLGRIVMCQMQQQSGSTSASQVFAYTYDAPAQIYTLAGVTSDALPFVYSGSVQDGKWSFSRDMVWQGKSAKYEMQRTVDMAAGNATFVWRMSVAGGPWIVTEEQKCKLQK